MASREYPECLREKPLKVDMRFIEASPMLVNQEALPIPPVENARRRHLVKFDIHSGRWVIIGGARLQGERNGPRA